VITVSSLLHASVPALLHFSLHVPRGLGAYLPGTVLAVLSAVLFGVGCVLQHDAAAAASGEGGLRFRAMVRRPTWLVGQLSTVAGSGLQVAALALAPVSIVQPLLAAALIVALGLRSVRTRCWPSSGELLGAALTAGGLAVFLAAARPAPGTSERLPQAIAVIGAVLLGVLVIAAAYSTDRTVDAALVERRIPAAPLHGGSDPDL
jgi:hypothetical protein